MTDSVPYFGLTGGIASGKSTVARAFENLGARIIDADRIGHEVLRAPSEAYDEIVRVFGKGVLDASGVIDRRILGSIVFADPEKLRQLNTILHPRIIQRIEELAREYHDSDRRAVILVDAALVFEAGIGGRFAKVIVAWCRPEQQIERLMAKSGIAREEAARRIAAQMPADEKRRRADYVIDCSESLESIREQAAKLFPELGRIAGSH